MSELEQRIAAGAPAAALTVDVVRGRMRAALFGPAPAPSISARYTILERLGEGGMGTVWAAWDGKLDRKVALKLLRPESADDPAAAHRRILREAQALARVADPHVVAVFDVTSWAPPDAPEREHVLLAMEFIAGETLAGWLVRERPLAAVISKFVDAARGLMAAHGAGVVHGDFKPANVIVGDDGRARVVDFGLARMARAPARDGGAVAEPGRGAATEATGGDEGIAGTPQYMAPEQHQGLAVDERADQYALCVSLWEAVMREPPFRGDSMTALLDAKLAFCSRRAPAGMPRWLHRALVRGLAPAPAARHASIAALVSVLERGLAPRWRAPAALVVVGAAVATFVAVRDPDPCGGGDERLAEVWGGASRERARVAFERSGLAYAEVTYRSTAALLDAWTTGWAAAWRDACQTHRAGTQSDELLDLRMTCLESRLEHLAGLAALYVEANADTVEHAVQAASRLPAIERCNDPVALRQVLAVPEDPAVRSEVAALARQLAQARAQFDAGRHRVAATASDAVLSTARAMTTVHLPLVADALALHADAMGWLGEVEIARDQWREAALLARRSGDDELFVRASAGLVFELANAGEGFDSAGEWAAVADATAARAGDPAHARYLLHNAAGTLAMYQGAFDRGRDELVAGLGVVERGWGPTDVRAMVLHTNLGNLELRARHVEAALEHHRAALELGVAVLGLEHPRVIVARYDLAVTLVSADRSPEAVDEFERILALRTAGNAADPEIGWTLTSLAMAETNISRDRSAVDHADQALERLGSDPTAGYGRAVARLARARAAAHLGELDPARRDATAALTELRAGPHTPGDESEAQAILAEIALARPDGRDVEPELLAALRAAEVAGDRNAAGIALRRLAELERSRGRPALALGWIAAAMLQLSGPGSSTRLAATQLTLVDILLDLGDLEGASVQLAAVAIPEGAPPQWATDRVLTEARVDLLRGDRAAARARVVAHRRLLDEASTDRARLDRWLDDPLAPRPLAPDR